MKAQYKITRSPKDGFFRLNQWMTGHRGWFNHSTPYPSFAVARARVELLGGEVI